MGTTSEKLTYLNDTKGLLKQKINNLGGSIDDNTTFRQYANQLQNVYDNLPKTEYQEGTEINLGKTIKGKLDYDNGVVGIGQTEQDSTKGYQLAKPYNISRSGGGITWVTQNSQISASGSASSNEQSVRASDITNDMIISLSSGTYCISGGRSNLRLQIVKYDNGSVNQLALDSGSGATFTLNETTNIVYRGSILAGTALTGTVVIKPMLESDTTAHDWEKYTGGQASPNPSYKEDVKSVNGNQDVVVSGKNEFNSEIEQGGYYANGTPSESNNLIRTKDMMKIYDITDNHIFSNTNNLVIDRILFFDNTGTLISRSDSIDSAVIQSSIIPNNTTFIKLTIKKSNFGTVTPSDLVNAQLEKGSTATTYEPYITPTTYQLSLGDNEFNGIGDYKDELIYDVDEDKVYKNEKIIKRTFTGANTEYWQNGEFGTNSFYIAMGNAFHNIQDNTPQMCMANLFRGIAFVDRTTSGDNTIYLVYGGQIYIRNTSYTSVADFKNMLASNNLVSCYVAETPTLTEITDETLINQVKALYNAHSLKGTTIITSNGDLPIVIKVRGLKGE